MADPMQVRLRLVDESGTALSGLETRIVVGSEPESQTPRAGARVRTDGDGTAIYEVEAPVKSRRVKLDSFFVRHPSQLIEVGVELELLGRRALYWIELDLVKAGPVADMRAYVAGPDGNFDRALVFHHPPSWSIPDDPSGLRLTNIGCNLLSHDMRQLPDRSWEVDLVLEKQIFRTPEETYRQ